ncbi:unnamed protein product [Parnassius apollo]|uniref:(apollo) hypothetical protein n=1 Tax=Parnassius apollo TaxID=110799 RepID=A0A8S3XE61_PARAO|nr:unnamed protein product [Parnassius apollo]
MHLILALSVIILQQFDLYSCHSLTRRLDDLRFHKLPEDSIQSYEFTNSEFSDLIHPIIYRIPSEKANKAPNNFDKLTIEPYQQRNYTNFKWRRNSPLPRLNKQKKTFGPLAIIVTNLPDLTKLKEKQYKHLKETENLKEIKDEIKPIAVSKESMKYSKPMSTEINRENSKVFDSKRKSTGENAQEANIAISKNVDSLNIRSSDEVSDNSNENILKIEDIALNHFKERKGYENIASDTRNTENEMLYYSQNESDSNENGDVIVSNEILHDKLRSDDQVRKTESTNENKAEMDSMEEGNVERVLTEKQTSLEKNPQSDEKLITQAHDDFVTRLFIDHSHENDNIIKRLDSSEGNRDEIAREPIINNIDKQIILDHDFSVQFSKQSEGDNSTLDDSEYIPIKIKEDEKNKNNVNYKEAEAKTSDGIITHARYIIYRFFSTDK